MARSMLIIFFVVLLRVTTAFPQAAVYGEGSGEYILRDNIKHSLVVASDGSGDFTTVKEALTSIENSAFNNQYEVLLRPGRYKESSLRLPAYTHLKGIGGQEAVIIYDDMRGAPWIIDQPFPSKISNLTLDILNSDAYVMHYDAPTLSNGVTVNKNLTIIHRGGHTGSVVIGGGSWENYISVWENCRFAGAKGVPACHTKQNSRNAMDLRFINCSFASGFSLGSVGGYEMSTVSFNNCNFQAPCSGWISLIKNEPELWKYPANNFEWKITGSGNKGFVCDLINMANAGEALQVAATAFARDISISGTAATLLFGTNYKTTLSNSRIKGKITGWSDVRDVQSGLLNYSTPVDVIQMWKRLGDCSNQSKTLIVTVNGNAQTFTFNKNYLIEKPAESTIIAAINSTLTHAFISKVKGIDLFEALDMPEKITAIAGDSNGIIKDELVYFDGYTTKKAASASDRRKVNGIAVSEARQGDILTIWKGNMVVNLNDGEYGVGANNKLSFTESEKIGYVKNKIFYPYY